MQEECVGGVWVPAPIAAHIRKEELVPFSYTKPNVKFLLSRARQKLPKAIAFKLGARRPQKAVLECGKFDKWIGNIRSSLVEALPLAKKDMAQPVHLQYNSPMPIYSRETAEEQYRQQIGGGSTPIPMPSGDKHFDPAKSATLKLLKEGDEGHFGEHFFEKIASVEAPKQIPQEEPDWARYAREKSERARSRTPADPSQHHTPATTPTYYYEGRRPESYHERQRETTPHEFIDKTRTYTHTNQPRWGPSYSQTLPNRRRVYSETRERTPGYEYGGLDYTKGLHFPAAPYDYVFNRRSRADDQQRRFRPGYELGGSDFGKGGYISDGPYHGHGPDPPRLRPHYSADPRSACNSYYAPNVDEVDANLLVGDTISNQKIRHENRHINQNEFGTSFAPPGGFKRDHTYVRRPSAPPEPVTFSLSANKNRYGYGSTGNISYQPRERDSWRQSQINGGEKEVNVQTLLNDDVLRKRERSTTPTWRDHSVSKQEAWMHRSDPRLNRNQIYPSLSRNFEAINQRVFTNEPNWSRTVQQRRNAWEQKAYDTDARVNLPASAKVPPPQPPAWHNKAAKTHNVWQQAADTMSQPQQQSYETNYYSSGGDSHKQYRAEYHHEERRSESQQSQQQQYQQRREEQQYTQAVPVQQSYISPNTANGTNADLLLNSGPKYPGSHYEQSSQYSKSYSSSTQQQNVPQQEPIPLSGPGQTYSYSTETRTTTTTQGGPVNGSFQQSSYNQSSYSTDQSKSIPVERRNEESSYQKSVTENTRSVLPAPAPPQATVEEERFKKMFSSEQARNVPIQQTYTTSEGSHFQKNTTTSKEETHVIPIQPARSEIKESYQRSETSKSETTSRAIPVQPVSSIQDSQNKMFTSSSTTQPLTVAPPPQGYTTSSSYHTETHTTQPPVVMHSPGGSYKSFQSSHYSKQEKTTSTTTTQPQTIRTTTLPITKTTTYDYQQQAMPTPQPAPQMTQSSFTTHTEKTSTTTAAPIQPAPMPRSNYEAQFSSHREESRREETSRPTSQLSQYSEQRSYKRNVEEKTETKTIPATTSILTSDANKTFTAQDVFNKREEMNETLPLGSISNTRANTQGEYRDLEGHDVSYKRETQTAVDPGKEYALLKEEERRVVEKDLEPGVISRHVTTKYYKKKTVTDTTTTTNP
ncbi:unnamed protein product [Cylicocyclus nassatus]|uniref:Zasp-like motif domain-containing protein n=2 Tax=Strongylidae TaxID=27830 RepID=A0AA36M8H1_CYLNA|nr:unnamed protein product [Cylicocyclus nassatus]